MTFKKYKADKEERLYLIPDLGGVEYPSVTTIIGQLDKSGPLMGWAVKMTLEYLQTHPDELRREPTETFKLAKQYYRVKQEEALDFGSSLHALIEDYLKNNPIDNWFEICPELKPAFLEFHKWQKEYEFELKETEHTVWSDYKYAGTLDCVARLKGKLYVVDFKSSKAIYDDYLMQIAAYKNAYEERTGVMIEGLGILRLPKVKDDTFEWKEYTLEQSDNSFDEFMCLVSYWWTKKRRKDAD
jgi:hypothetical protein